jgi:hypothetical protein
VTESKLAHKGKFLAEIVMALHALRAICWPCDNKRPTMQLLVTVFLSFLIVLFVYAAWVVALSLLGQAGEWTARACRRLVGRR